MSSPREVNIEITSRCNLRCSYCSFFENEERSYGELATSQWLKFFDELGRVGVMRTIISGGEPFIRGDLPELIAGIVANRMRFAILSNGSLVTDELADCIVESGRCDYVQISIDGHRREIHEISRGPGSFSGALHGLSILKKRGCPLAVRLTVHKGNVDYLTDIAQFLLEELELASFGVNSAGYLGSCRSGADSILLSVAEREKAMFSLLELSRKYPGRISATAGPLAEGRHWAEMEQVRCGAKPPPARGGRLTGCGCVFSSISVQSDGTYIPCLLLPHLALGRVAKDSLREVWNRSEALTDLRSRSNLPLANFSHCSGCGYISSCTGNCPALAYSQLGEVNHPSPDACLRDYLAAGGRLPKQDHAGGV